MELAESNSDHLGSNSHRRKHVCECLTVHTATPETILRVCAEEQNLCQICFLPQERPPVHLVLDLKFDLAVPFNFRCAKDGMSCMPEETISELGLKELRISGSGQPTPAGLKWILSHLDIEPNQLLVLDLRQEGHGFACEKPVTWHSIFNWANVGRDVAWIVADEQNKLESFGYRSQVEFFEEVKTPANPDGVLRPHKKVPMMKNCVGISERALVESLGAHYIRLTVTDHASPGDEQVDRFVKIVRKYSSSRHLHMHCRAGRGRTTMFMSLIDMLYNSNSVSCEDITRRQGHLPKDRYDLMKIPKNWKNMPMAERARFMLEFYEYSKEHPITSASPISWSHWKALTQRSS